MVVPFLRSDTDKGHRICHLHFSIQLIMWEECIAVRLYYCYRNLFNISVEEKNSSFSSQETCTGVSSIILHDNIMTSCKVYGRFLYGKLADDCI